MFQRRQRPCQRCRKAVPRAITWTPHHSAWGEQHIDNICIAKRVGRSGTGGSGNHIKDCAKMRLINFRLYRESLVVKLAASVPHGNWQENTHLIFRNNHPAPSCRETRRSSLRSLSKSMYSVFGFVLLQMLVVSARKSHGPWFRMYSLGRKPVQPVWATSCWPLDLNLLIWV